VYSETGLARSAYRGTPYYPTRAARRLLDAVLAQLHPATRNQQREQRFSREVATSWSRAAPARGTRSHYFSKALTGRHRSQFTNGEAPYQAWPSSPYA